MWKYLAPLTIDIAFRPFKWLLGYRRYEGEVVLHIGPIGLILEWYISDNRRP
jgi:hypothetical protein